MISVTWVAIFADGTHATDHFAMCEKSKAKGWLHCSVNNNLSGRSILRFWYMLGTEAQEYTPGEVEEVFFS